jgi:hypothetical protein
MIVPLMIWSLSSKLEKLEPSHTRKFPRVNAQNSKLGPIQPWDVKDFLRPDRGRGDLVELGFQHRLQEFTGSIAKGSFNRIEPIVEKVYRSFGFRLRLVRHRAMACHGVISAGSRRNRLLHQAGDYAAFNFQPLPLRHLSRPPDTETLCATAQSRWEPLWVLGFPGR